MDSFTLLYSKVGQGKQSIEEINELFLKNARNLHPLYYTIEFDQIKKEFPEAYKKYLRYIKAGYCCERDSYCLLPYIETPKESLEKPLNETPKVSLEKPLRILLSECCADIIEHLEELLANKPEIQKQTKSMKASKDEKHFDRITGSFSQLSKIFEKMLTDRHSGLHLCEYPETKKIDQFKICSEIDQFKIKYPDTHLKYLRQLLIEYTTLMFSKDEFIAEYLPEYGKEFIDPYGYDVLFTTIDYIVDHLKDIFKIEDVRDMLNPETSIFETPQKFETLKPIEKILIIHYLKIESLKRYQYHLKPGVFLDTPDKISSVRRNKLTTFRRSKWLGFAGAN